MKNAKFLFVALFSLGLFISSCSDDDDDDDVTPTQNNQTTPAVNPIVGDWTAYDVSGILSGAGVDSITAAFNANNTYLVVSTSSGSNTTYEGTYTVSADPDTAGIYTILLNQSLPSTATSEGIFKVYAASPDSMWYEVAQTNPTITGVTAPTQAGGFGSTSAGAYGTANIQKYTRD